MLEIVGDINCSSLAADFLHLIIDNNMLLSCKYDLVDFGDQKLLLNFIEQNFLDQIFWNALKQGEDVQQWQRLLDIICIFQQRNVTKDLLHI